MTDPALVATYWLHLLVGSFAVLAVVALAVVVYCACRWFIAGFRP